MADETILDGEFDQAEQERAYAAEDRRYRVAAARQRQAKPSTSQAVKAVDQALELANKAPVPVQVKIALGIAGYLKSHPQVLWMLGGFLFLYSLLQFLMILTTFSFVAYVVTNPIEVVKVGGLAGLGFVIELLKFFGLPST